MDRDDLGYPDDLKFHSSMTVFALAAKDPVFTLALEKYFEGKLDEQTVAILDQVK